MKKFCKGLALIVCLFIFPLLVFADMGIPDIQTYDVIITNKDGVVLKSRDGKKVTIPYDTKIHVSSEYYDQNKKVLYGYVEYNGVYGEIDLSKVKVASEEVDLSKYSKYSEPKKLYVYREGAYLYKGPSTVYGKVDNDVMVPVGETVSYEYFDETWAYTEYNGVKGWILTYSYSDLYADLKVAVADVKNSKVYLTKDVKELYVNPAGKEKVKVNIPKDKELEYKYSFSSVKAYYVYVEYEDAKGWLYVDDSIPGSNGENLLKLDCYTGITISDDIYVYDTFNNLKSKTDKKIAPGTEFTIDYMYQVWDKRSNLEGVWMHIIYNKEAKWIYADKDAEYEYNHGIYYVRKAEQELDVFELPVEGSKILGTLSKGSKVDEYYSYSNASLDYDDLYYDWYYVKTKDVSGWVLQRYVSDSEEDAVEVCILPTVEEPKKTDDDKEEKDSEKLKPMQIAMIAIAGAVVLVLVAVVTIKLVNKKKED